MKGAPQSHHRKNGRPRHRAAHFVLRPIAWCVMLACVDPALANPTGAQVAAGAAALQAVGKTLNITNTPGTIINWRGFSIGSGEHTRFLQPSAASAVLNRVVGPDPSSILGTLSSNGRVFLVNPHGIVFGASAVIDTAGFIASTLNMADRDFLAGRFKFDGGGNGVLRNEGTIRASGDILLVGPTIENAGIIRSDAGSVLLAAGKSVTITSPDAQGVQFTLQAPEDTALNLGTIEASGAAGMFAGTLRHSGDIRAEAVSVTEGGRVVLAAQKDATVESGASISASGAQGGSVTIQSGDTTLVAGSVDATASAGPGGTIQILGNRVGLLDGARVNASGETGGGTILVGGDFQGRNPEVQNAWRTFVAADTSLRADAITSGDGGKVIVWADDTTRFYGKISARGGAQAGDGGFVETSGKEGLTVGGTARVEIGAPSGRGGTWLLDPKNIIVQNGGGAPRTDVDDFADQPGSTQTIAPVTISDTTGTVFLRADNDITFVDNYAVGQFQATSLTAQAGRSILVNANITDATELRLTANETTAAGVTAANREAGAAKITMAAGKTLSGGDIFLRVNSGAGHDGTSGDIVVENITAANVSIIHDGPTANSSILRASVNSLITGTTAVFVELEVPAGATASIGTAAAPIRVATPVLEAHYHNATGGIFFESPNARGLQIGGVPAPIFAGAVRGVQTISGGPIQVSVNGTLTQLAGAAACGATGGTGGPICAGPTPASGTAAADDVTLRAIDMGLTMPVSGNDVFLLPQAGGTISPGTAGGPPSLYLTQAELDLVDAASNSLHIGENASGNIAFGSNIITPGAFQIEFRSGGAITTSGAATDITARNPTNHITLVGASIGTTGAGRFKVNPGTANVSATSTTGGLFLEQSVGNLDFGKYTVFVPVGGTAEVATTNGTMMLPGDTFNGDATLNLITQGTSMDIAFTGTNNLAITSLALAPTGSTTINSGTTNFNAPTPVTTSRPISIGGGTANFNGAVTASTVNGTLMVSSGTANINAASTFAGAVTVSNTGVLGGTGAVAANNGLTFTGGTISNTGGVTIPGTTTINAGTPSLTGTLSTGVLNYTGGTFGIGAAGILSLTGGGASTIDGRPLTNAGVMNVVGGGNLLLNNGATLTNNGTLDFQSNAGVQYTSGAIPTLSNTGTLRKSAGTGTSAIGISFPITFTNSGTLNVQTGTIEYASNNTFNDGTQFTGAGTNLVTTSSTFNGTVTSNGLTLQSGNFGGNANLAGTTTWTGGSITGTLTVPNGATLNLTGGGAKTVNGATASLTNSGTLNVVGSGNLLLNSAATLTNNATLDFQSNAGVQYTTGAIPTLANSATGTLKKSAGTTSIIGISFPITFTNAGILDAAAGTTIQYQSNNTFTNGAQFTGAGSNLVTTNSTFTGTSTSANLTLQSGNFGGGGSLAGTTAWTGGTINGNLTVPNGATLNLNGGGAKTVSGATLTNAGMLNVVGGGNLLLNSAATLTNTGTFDFQSDAGVQYATGAIPTLSNTGTLRKSAGAGTSTIGISNPFTFTNSGTLNVQTGTIQYQSNNTFNDGTQFTGAGTNLVTTNSTFNGTITSNGLTLQSGNFAGTASFAGTTTWTGGTMLGTFTVPVENTLNLTGVNNKTVTGATLTNSGTMNIAGTGNLVLNGGGVTNNGLLDLQSAADITQLTPSTLTNAGTLRKSASPGTTSTIGGAGFTFNNNAGGTIHVLTGTLQTNGGFATNSGTINVDAGAVFSTNAQSLNNMGTIKGSGQMNLGGAANGTLSNNGTVAPGASAGTLFINGNFTQGPNGVLQIDIGGTTQGVDYDLLQIAGTANLDGTLAVSLFGGFVPVVGNNFDFMTYANRNGDFATFNFPAGTNFQSQPNPTFYRLTLATQQAAGNTETMNKPSNDVLVLEEQFFNYITPPPSEPVQQKGSVPECR